MHSKFSPDNGNPPATNQLLSPQECRDIYMYEINGIGLRYKFDVAPKDFPEFLKDEVPQHAERLKDLVCRIRQFDKFDRTMQTFAGQTVAQKVVNPYEPKSMSVVERTIPETSLQAYDTFGHSLASYAIALHEWPDSPQTNDEVIGAALDVCKVVRPDCWDPDQDELVLGLPNYTAPLTSTEPRWFLEALMEEQGR